MDCEQAGIEIQKLLDGEISVPRRDELLRHCGECEACRAVYRAFGMLADELKRLPMPQPGPDFKAAVISKLKTETDKPAKLSGLLTATALLLAPSLAASVYVFFTTGKFISSISFRQEEFSAFLSYIPVLDNLRASFLLSYGYQAQHPSIAAFLSAVTVLILICQVKPQRHLPRRQL